MHRFFVTPEQIKDSTITITGEDVKHLTKVLRIADDELFEVCDGQGTDYLCKIAAHHDDAVLAAVQKTTPSAGENPYHLTLFQGLPKGQKLEDIVQKGTACGINRFVPFTSTYCVAKIKDRRQAQKKQVRLQRVAYEAAKQSKRGVIPRVDLCEPFSEMASELTDFDLVIFAYEHESEQTLKQALAPRDLRKLKTIAVIVGSEGGFSPDEAARLRACGALSVSLGKRILRTETAGIVIAAQINYAFE